MKSQILIICAALALFTTCKDIQDEENVVRTVTIDPAKEIISDSKFNDLFKLQRVVNLETTNESVLKGIAKIILHRNEIYILDNLNSNILVFEANGKFKQKINRSGNGPGEYLFPEDFDINLNTLYIFDGLNGKILCYTLPDLKFSKAIKVSDGVGLKVFNNRRFAINSGFNTADLNKKSRNFGYTYYIDEISSIRDIETNQYLIGRSFSLEYGKNFFYTFNDTTFALFQLNDTIYRINDDGTLIPYLYVNFGVERPEVRDSQQKVNAYLKEGKYNSPSSIFAFYKFGRLVLFSYFFENKKQNVIVDEASSKIIYKGTYFDVENKLPVRVTPYSVADSGSKTMLLLSVFWPFEIKDKNKPPVKDIDENENPVLVFYKFNGHEYFKKH